MADRPLIIAAYSFGGKVARELARHLVLAGEGVAFLAILDTDLTANERVDAYAPNAQNGLARLKHDVRIRGIRKTLAIRAGYRLALCAYRSPASRRFAARRRHVPLPPDVAFAFEHYMVWFVRAALAKAWQPATLPTRTMLFRSESNGTTAPRDLGWSVYTPELTVETIGGTHDSMIVGREGERLARTSGPRSNRTYNSIRLFDPCRVVARRYPTVASLRRVAYVASRAGRR